MVTRTGARTGLQLQGQRNMQRFNSLSVAVNLQPLLLFRIEKGVGDCFPEAEGRKEERQFFLRNVLLPAQGGFGAPPGRAGSVFLSEQTTEPLRGNH